MRCCDLRISIKWCKCRNPCKNYERCLLMLRLFAVLIFSFVSCNKYSIRPIPSNHHAPFSINMQAWCVSLKLSKKQKKNLQDIKIFHLFSISRLFEVLMFLLPYSFISVFRFYAMLSEMKLQLLSFFCWSAFKCRNRSQTVLIHRFQPAHKTSYGHQLLAYCAF